MGITKGTNAALAPPLDESFDDSFTGKLVENRRNEIRAFAIALRNDHFLQHIASDDGDESFGDLIELAVREYGVSQKELATALHTSPPTVSRWLSRLSTPPLYARKGIVEAIALIVDHNLDL